MNTERLHRRGHILDQCVTFHRQKLLFQFFHLSQGAVTGKVDALLAADVALAVAALAENSLEGQIARKQMLNSQPRKTT